MDTERIVKFWLESSAEDFMVARDLFKLNHFSYCLFFCHLAVEKLLKAIIVKKTEKHAPFIHDLAKLAKIACLEVNEEQKKQFEIITTFNIRARYDRIKRNFYQKVDESYATKWIKNTEEIITWLKASV